MAIAQEMIVEFSKYLHKHKYRVSTLLQYKSVANSYERWRSANGTRRGRSSMRLYLETFPSLATLRRGAAALRAYYSFLNASGRKSDRVREEMLSPAAIWRPWTTSKAKSLFGRLHLPADATWIDVLSRAAKRGGNNSAREDLVQFAERMLPLRRTICDSLHLWHVPALTLVPDGGTFVSANVPLVSKARFAEGKSNVRIGGRRL
jgi:hypothetical protein